MCINYKAPTPEILVESFSAPAFDAPLWPEQIWKDYPAPIIKGDGLIREATVGTYGIWPQKRIPEGVRKWDTMNARSETLGQLKSFKKPWMDGQLCLVPLTKFYEPNYESGKYERWGIGMADGSPFAVAGLWRNWENDDGTVSAAFTQITINADTHPMMKRFHKPGDEKRSLVILPHQDWDAWLACRDPELARSFLGPFPAELMAAEPAPLPKKVKQ